MIYQTLMSPCLRVSVVKIVFRLTASYSLISFDLRVAASTA